LISLCLENLGFLNCSFGDFAGFGGGCSPVDLNLLGVPHIPYSMFHIHEYGTAESKHSQTIHPCRKGQKMNSWENLYIQIYRQQDRLITEQQVNEPNPLYELAQLPQNRDDSTHPDTTPTSTVHIYTQTGKVYIILYNSHIPHHHIS
jgi:hypothetical protein